MANTPFKTRIRSTQPAIGTLVTLNSADIVEALSMCGFDWLFIDMEHGPIGISDAQEMVRATGGRCPAMVRIPENSPLWIRRVLDIGSDGIIVPLVQSAADAELAVEAAHYPPEGKRSVGIGRAHGYGLRFGQYVTEAKDRVTVIVQVEHVAAVEQIDDIIAVRGVDGILIGPYDLSGSMNRLGDVGHPEVQAAIARVRQACGAADMPVGIFVLDPANVASELERGLDFLAVGTDAAFMTGAARAALATTGVEKGT